MSLHENIYLDETAQTGSRFLVIGGITIPLRLSQQLESDIIAARQPRLCLRLDERLEPSEISWSQVSTGDFEPYKKVVDAYFSFARRHLGTTSLEAVEFHSSVVDTHVRGRRYSGKSGDLGFNREIYFHCMSIARRHSDKIFDVFPDERQTKQSMVEMKTILCRGLRREFPLRPSAFRKVEFRKSHHVQALQVSDILIGAIQYRLNRHYDAAVAANKAKDKRLLCEHILREGGIWNCFGSTSFRTKDFGRFQMWFRKHMK